ncbi:MAG: thioredoxin [Chloroflexi bacterium]|nr:thioredoxin [Chloroflexota bacterium]
MGGEQAGVLEISDATFKQEVLDSSLPVVVDFWAPWCGPCRMIGPIMEKLSTRYAGRIKFCKINVDENPQSAAKYQAMSIPLLVFFKGGGEAGRSVGALPEPALRSKIESIFG